MASFELSPEADADLDGIFDYTARLWSVEQGHKYLLQLNACMEQVAAGKGQPKNFSHIRPGLRSIRCQRHIIFFVQMDDMTARVVAAFHEKMDLMTRIAERLL